MIGRIINKIHKNTNEQELFMEKIVVMSGGRENRVLLGLKKVTATRRVKADSPLTVRITKSEA